MNRACCLRGLAGLPFLITLVAGAVEPRPQAVFQGGDSLQRAGNVVFGWHNTADGTVGRHLTRGEGRPRAWQVITGSGKNLVVRLDGSSALWSPHNVLGTLTNEFTIVAYVRVRGTNGFLFDGSSNVGMARAQIRDGMWQMGVQPAGIRNAAAADAPTHPAKMGEWQTHAFVFRSVTSGTQATHYINGRNSVSVFSPTSPRLTGLVLGANARVEEFLAADIAEFALYATALDDEQVARVSSALHLRWAQIKDSPEQDLAPAVFKDPQVFRTILRKRGDDGVACYRIPGLATTTNGTLLAVFDIRHKSCGDLPADIDVGLVRSTDDGTTWSPMQRILDFDATEPNSNGNGVGDPCILVDRRTGTVFVAALWSHGDRGWHGSGSGMLPAETGQFLLTRSDDDGLTWSAPINITSQIKKPEWRLVLQGPGAGIQLRDGTLVFPAQHRGANGRAHAFFIFSKDAGNTWTSSAIIDGPDVPEMTEAQMAELSDGSLLITLRNHAGKGLRAWSRWEWSGALAHGSWSPLTYANEDPVCQASLIRANDEVLVFANPASATTRSALSLRFSRDDGRSWSAPRLLDSRPAAYSSMTILRDGSIGILYECGDAFAADTLTFARFPLAWVLSATSESRLRPAKVFSDNMVLQRDVPVPVWGVAIPGATIEVEFAGQIVKTEASADGQWKIRLKALSANAQPRELRMTASLAGGQTENVTLTNVLVGEVWVAAGQSNMEWPLERDELAAETLASAGPPAFRLLNLDFVTKYGFGRPFTPEQISRLTPSGFFSGAWIPSTPDAARPFSAVAFHFGRELQRELNLPVGIIHLAVGGSPTEAWIRREAFQSVKSLQPLTAGNWLTNTLLGPWCRERGLQNLARPEKDGLAIPGDSLGPNHPFKPAFLWEAGIAPLLPFAMRGVIWYQGESNAEEQWRVQQHEDLFPLLVGDWRAQWGMGDFPFLFCQLSSISTEKGYKAEFWPEFRDSQRRMLARIPNSAMAVTSDVGHPTDVHPRNKRAVGQRLALAALGQVYGQGNEISGPLFASASRRGTELVLRFHHAKDLQSTDGLPPIGFEVGGADGRFHPATARIENDTVVLDISRVVSPASVRFGWQPYPRPPLNLINGVGLPASTFQARISTTELN